MSRPACHGPAGLRERLSGVSVHDCEDPEQRRAGLDEAVEALGRGQLVVLPTDTVYGLGADAFDKKAVARLLRMKGRGRHMPPPVLVGSTSTLDALATEIPAVVRDLVEAFWPGPLTIVCLAQPSLSWDLGETDGTVALRMPDHEVALELLQRTGPLAVSSANLSKKPPATSAAEAAAYFGGSVPVYLDAGRSPGSVPSTIIDATAERLTVLRHGALSIERLAEVAPELAAEDPAVQQPSAEQSAAEGRAAGESASTDSAGQETAPAERDSGAPAAERESEPGSA